MKPVKLFSAAMMGLARKRLHAYPEAARFLRFCIVGASSFLLSLAVFNLCYALTGKLIFSSTVSYLFSVTNSFLWSRRWIFKDRRRHTFGGQAVRFALGHMAGYSINLVVYAAFLAFADAPRNAEFDWVIFRQVFSAILSGHARRYSFLLVNSAGIAATIVAIAWNYMASRYWSFRR